MTLRLGVRFPLRHDKSVQMGWLFLFGGMQDSIKGELKLIQPGKPSQNGIIERLNGTLRRGCLNLEWFESINKFNEQI